MAENQALIVQPSRELLPAAQDWATMLQMAEMFAKSGLIPTGASPHAALVIMQKGRELGIPPMQALSSISVIKGKPSTSAELMRAIIYRDHGDDALLITESTAKSCTLSCKRRGWKERQQITFSMEDAIQAGLAGSETWKKYPDVMLAARCTSKAARLVFPDSIGGMYLPEEAAEIQDSGATVAVQGTPPETGSLQITNGGGHGADKPVKRELADDAPCSARGVAVLAGLAEKLRGMTGDVVGVPDGLTNAEARELHLLISDALTAAERQAATDAHELAEVL